MTLDDVPQGARVGSSSLRRRSQLLALRPDLDVVDIRGNVETRLRKLVEEEMAGTILPRPGSRASAAPGSRASPSPSTRCSRPSARARSRSRHGRTTRVWTS